MDNIPTQKLYCLAAAALAHDTYLSVKIPGYIWSTYVDTRAHTELLLSWNSVILGHGDDEAPYLGAFFVVLLLQYIHSLLALNPAASVTEVRELVLLYRGDARKIAEVLKEVSMGVFVVS